MKDVCAALLAEAAHTTAAGEIYVLYVCWPGLIIQSSACEDPSMSRALSGSSRQKALLSFLLLFFSRMGVSSGDRKL